jgi:glycosyltransferase involved in cell wall biosynthesis
MKSQETAKKPHKIMAIVPVYNEAENLHKTLNPLNDMLNEGKIDGIIAINDGSKDSSQKKLEAYLENPGFINIVLPENMGKAFAFYCAAKVSYQMGADIILMLDADILKLSEIQINMLIEPIIENPEINMVIGEVKGEGCISVVGQRAIRTESLLSLIDETYRRKDWLELFIGIEIDNKNNEHIIHRVGYGLERSLNALINIRGKYYTCLSEQVVLAKTNFKCGPMSDERKRIIDKTRPEKMNTEGLEQAGDICFCLRDKVICTDKINIEALRKKRNDRRVSKEQKIKM